MGILLGVLLVAFSTIIIVANNNGDMAIQNARHALTLAESKQLYDAAQTGISEAIAERFQPRSNRYSLISSTTPLHGMSGRLYSDTSNPTSANVLASYRYMVLGGVSERTAAGAVDTSRMTAVDTLQPAFIISKADGCFDNFKSVPGALSVSGSGVPSCSSGTLRSLTLFAKLDLSRSTSSKDVMTQLRVVNDDTAIPLDTTVFIPASGDGTSVNFETAWQGGSGSNTGATLTHVVVDNNGTVTTYPVSTGSLDITGSGDIDPTNTKIWFVFNDGLDFRSLYTGTTSFNECFTNSALDCGIVVSEDDSAGSPINAKVLPTFPAGNRVLIDADYPSYTNGDSSARNSWFDISIPASTIRDWYGNYAPAFTLTAKSPDPVAACTTTTTHNVSTSGTSPAPFDTWNPGDNQNWTVNLNSGATGHSFEQPGSCDSTWNASSGSEVFIIEPGTGVDNLNLTGAIDIAFGNAANSSVTISDFNTTSLIRLFNLNGSSDTVEFQGGCASDYTHTTGSWTAADTDVYHIPWSDQHLPTETFTDQYTQACSGTDPVLWHDGTVETVNFTGSCVCSPPPPPPPTCGATQYATASVGSGAYNYNDATPYDVTVNNLVNGYNILFGNSCDNTVFIEYPDSSGTENGGDVVVEGGSATDTLDLPGFVDQYTVAASPSLPSPYVCLDTICGTEICYDDNVETVTYGTDVLACAPPPCTHTPIYPSTNPYTTTYEYEEVHVAGGVVNVDHHHTWVYGSNAIETINLDGSSISNTSCPNYTFFFHTYGGDDLVNITDSQDALGITVFSGDGNDTINVDDSQVSSVYDRIKLDLGADNDTVNIYNDAWETQVYGGDGDDTVNVYYDDNHATWSSQFCKFQGGAGTDIINFPYTATAVSYSHVSGGCYGGSHLQVLVTTASGTHPFRIDHEVESIIMNNYTVDVTSIPTSGSGTLYP